MKAREVSKAPSRWSRPWWLRGLPMVSGQGLEARACPTAAARSRTTIGSPRPGHQHLPRHRVRVQGYKWALLRWAHGWAGLWNLKPGPAAVSLKEGPIVLGLTCVPGLRALFLAPRACALNCECSWGQNNQFLPWPSKCERTDHRNQLISFSHHLSKKAQLLSVDSVKTYDYMLKLIVLSYSYKYGEEMSAYFLTHINPAHKLEKMLSCDFLPSEKPYIPSVSEGRTELTLITKTPLLISK